MKLGSKRNLWRASSSSSSSSPGWGRRRDPPSKLGPFSLINGFPRCRNQARARPSAPARAARPPAPSHGDAGKELPRRCEAWERGQRRRMVRPRGTGGAPEPAPAHGPAHLSALGRGPGRSGPGEGRAATAGPPRRRRYHPRWLPRKAGPGPVSPPGNRKETRGRGVQPALTSARVGGGQERSVSAFRQERWRLALPPSSYFRFWLSWLPLPRSEGRMRDVCWSLHVCVLLLPALLWCLGSGPGFGAFRGVWGLFIFWVCLGDFCFLGCCVCFLR